MHTVDALVAGAGPVGLTMAAELIRHGVSCRIIDKSPVPSDKSKALVVWSRTLELLADMGAAEHFIAAGRPVHRMRLFGNGEPLVEVPLDKVDSPYRYALMIPQNETERLLDEHVRRLGGNVERAIEIVAFQRDSDGVVCTLRQASGADETVRARWLIGCDGAHSCVRHTLGIDFAGAPEPHDWVLADVHVDGPLGEDEVTLFWHEQGLLAFFPIPPNRFRAIAEIGRSTTPQPPTPTLAEAQALVDARGPGGLRLHDPVWLAGFRINERKVRSYRHGPIFLAGDAAHIHSPAGGQGMNTGMQDAYNLGWKLALVSRGRGRTILLDSYDSERSAVGDMVLQRAGAMTRVGTLSNPTAQRLRNRIAPILLSLGIVRHRVTSMLSEIDINYRGSVLSGDSTGHAWFGGAPFIAGDRIPDAPLFDPVAQTSTTLFAILRGTRHVLLLLAGPSREATDLDALARVRNDVARRYGDEIVIHLVVVAASASPAWEGSTFYDLQGALHARLGAAAAGLFLVRPDGYLGYASQTSDGDVLMRHLARYLIPGG